MKKFTLIVAMLLCVAGFSQENSVNELGPNNPTYPSKAATNKQVKTAVGNNSLQVVSPDQNNPVFKNAYSARLENLSEDVSQRRADSDVSVANSNNVPRYANGTVMSATQLSSSQLQQLNAETTAQNEYNQPMYHAAGAQLVEAQSSIHNTLLSGDVSYSTYQPQLIPSTSENNLPVIIVNSMGPVSPYSDMTAWQSDWGGSLTTEDFAGIISPPVCSSATPISSAGNDCFAAGEIIDNISVTGNPGDNVVLDVGFLGNSNYLVGANTFVDFGVIDFTGGDDVLAAGMVVFNNSDVDTDVRIFDTGGVLLASYTINAPLQTETFVGVISTEAIGSIEIEGANGSGELLGNLMIGTSGGGGGGGAACDQANASNAFENGRGCSANNNWTAANDFIVAAGEDATLTAIHPNIFMAPGATLASADITIYDDAGGVPGTMIDQQLGVVPTSQAVVGSNFGLDISTVDFDLTPVSLPGDAGSETSYWIAIQVTPSDGGTAFWEDNSVNVIGEFLAFNDGSGWTIPDVRDGVYTFEADCTPIGGGGGGTSDCSLVGPGNGFENGKSCTQNLGRIVAHDFVVAADSDAVLESFTPNVFIGGTGSGVNAAFVDIYIWGDNGGQPDPGNVIATVPGFVPTSQTVVGSNFGFDVWAVELDHPDVDLPGQAGSETTYWIGISLEATDGSNVFWENSTAGLIGAGEAYDDGVVGFVIDNTLEGVYTFQATCTGGGGGGTTTPCAETNPGNAFENGFFNDPGTDATVANDVTVAADTDFLLEQITMNQFHDIGATISSVDITYYDDAGGQPGAIIGSEVGVVPTSQAVVGSNFGFDVSEVVLDVTPFDMPGQAGATTTYWIDVSVSSSSGGITAWEATTASVVGNNMWQFFAGAWVDTGFDGVYTFSGQCTTGGGGGGGNDCSVSGPSNAFENGKSCTQNLGRIVAHDIDVPADQSMMLEVINANMFIGATGSGVNAAFVDIYIWGDNGGQPDPGNVIATVPGFVPTNQAVVGSNFGFDVWDVELDHPDVMLDGQAGAATTYWIGLSLEATDGSNVFWENSTAGLIGNGEAYNDGAGGGFVIDATLEGVYTFTASCEDLEPAATYDDCEGALDIGCGDMVLGSTIGATDDSDVAPDCDTPTTTPGVWYKFEDTSGLVADITLTTCSANTDYDTKISVYTGECNNPPLTCVAGNDDDPNCPNFQSTVEFTSDGNTTYYILVHGFGGQTGNFELTMTCDLIPPPNDDIENAIDLDEVGCPFTDEDVAMPAATEEDGTPTDCDITGAAGVWYKFTPELNGQITGTIATPGGAPGTNLTVNNGPLAGDYAPVAAAFGGAIPTTPLTADSAVVIDDDTTGDANDGCDPILNGGALNGKIAVIRRGACEFGLKALSAQNEGAVAVVVVNNQPGDPIAMGGGEFGDQVSIPAVMISDVEGEPIITELLAGGTVNMTLFSDPITVSSITFYTAPDESSIEDELVLVDWFQNQCLPSETATIPVTAGQTYYCFVVNTGAVSDIIFDNCQLGVDSNEIEGFVFYPNPANDRLNLSATQNIEKVALYNILGQKVIDMDVNATQTQVGVSNLASGAYIMEVMVDGQRGTYKVIKN